MQVFLKFTGNTTNIGGPFSIIPNIGSASPSVLTAQELINGFIVTLTNPTVTFINVNSIGQCDTKLVFNIASGCLITGVTGNIITTTTTTTKINVAPTTTTTTTYTCECYTVTNNSNDIQDIQYIGCNNVGLLENIGKFATKYYCAKKGSIVVNQTFVKVTPGNKSCTSNNECVPTTTTTTSSTTTTTKAPTTTTTSTSTSTTTTSTSTTTTTTNPCAGNCAPGAGWTFVNANHKTLSDGTPIQYEPNNGNWTIQFGFSGYGPKWCYWNNDPSTEALWGLCYNWAAVNHPNFAPAGYRVPTLTDYISLINCLGGNSTNPAAGYKMKSTTGWNSYPTPFTGNGDNSSCLNIRPHGMRSSSTGQFLYQGTTTQLWLKGDNGGTMGGVAATFYHWSSGASYCTSTNCINKSWGLGARLIKI